MGHKSQNDRLKGEKQGWIHEDQVRWGATVWGTEQQESTRSLPDSFSS